MQRDNLDNLVVYQSVGIMDAFERNIDAANTSNVLPVHEQKVVPSEPFQPQRLPEEVSADATGLNMPPDHSSQQEVVPNEPIGGPQRFPEEEVSTAAAGNSIVPTVHEQDIPVEPVGPPDATEEKPSHLIWGPEMMTKFVDMASTVDLNRKDAARKIHRLMAEPSTTLVQVKIYLKKYRVALMKIDKAKRNVLPVQQQQVVPNEPSQPQIILPEEVSADATCKAVTKLFDFFNTPPDHHSSSQQEVVPVEPHERLPEEVPTDATGKATNDFDLNRLPDDGGQQE